MKAYESLRLRWSKDSGPSMELHAATHCSYLVMPHVALSCTGYREGNVATQAIQMLIIKRLDGEEYIYLQSVMPGGYLLSGIPLFAIHQRSKEVFANAML